MRLALIAAVSVTLPLAANANVSNAGNMCRWLDSLDLLASPCQVSAQDTAVKVDMVASKSEARNICKTIAGTLRKDGVDFDRGWKLRISNPETANAMSVECKL